MPSPDVLPACVTREVRNRITIHGVVNVPVYCMNCHRHHGYCPERDASTPGYVGYLCDACAEKWSPVVGASLVPDEVHALRAANAMREDYGRVLTPNEQVSELADVNSKLSLLVR